MYEDEIPVGRAKDLRGKVFGRLTVLYRVANIGTATAWKCRCECGNIKNIRAKCLTTGETQSCGCIQKEAARKNGKVRVRDITGQKFGRLTALYPTEKRFYKCVIWHCKCECGNECDVDIGHLQSGNTQSCGCIQKEYTSGLKLDIAGKRFGKLVAIEPTNQHNNASIIWKCKCDCGGEKYASVRDLQSNRVASCGCLTESIGELKITQLLTEYEIPFEKQKSFDNCFSPLSERKLRFDFYIIENNYLIEFDGIQHYDDSNKWYSKEGLVRDEYKNKWCKENNIPLIRIPYTKLDTLCIEDLMLETTQFRVV